MTKVNWTYQGELVETLPDGVVGFVYLITNTTTGRMYVGKKLAKFKRSRPPLKGRKNKRRHTVESDWQDYFGSSNALLEDVEKHGKQNFKREILFYCKNRGECSYVEAREQFARKVLETDRYYNGHLNCHPVFSNRIQAKALSYRNGLLLRNRGENDFMSLPLPPAKIARLGAPQYLDSRCWRFQIK